MSALFHLQDLAIVLLLAFLEGILSIDNALVLALLARKLPEEQRKKALTYGLMGAVIFRLIALSLATYLMKWTWVKFVGGGYLVFVALQHLISSKSPESDPSKGPPGINQFWKAVLLIELTDIAFAIDSILAAVALSNKFWIVFTGGLIGVILIRFAASLFLGLLEKFPRFEKVAYQLVLWIGLKLLVDAFHFSGVNFHSPNSPAFWIFWGGLLTLVGSGFYRPKANQSKD